MRRFLVAVLILGFLLRVIGLSSYPIGFSADEASDAYDAYSLLKTGKDQWGEPWPIVLRSFGDFRPPVYAYLAIPSVAAFGLNEFAARLPSALLGSLAVLGVYLMVRKLFDDERLAFLSAVLLALSPWHIGLSRVVSQANLTVFFMTFGVWAFITGLKDKRFMPVAAIFFGINLFTYHSARLITPIVGIILLYLYRKELGFTGVSGIKSAVKKNAAALAIVSLFLGIAFYSLFMGAGARAGDVTIFNPTDKWMSVFERRNEAVVQGLPVFFARAFSNKLTHVFDQFVGRYVGYLSPQFLFTEGVSEWTYGVIPGRGVLFLFEIPFILASLWFLARYGLGKSKALTFVFLWILLSPFAAALTKGPGYVGNRAAVMMPAIQVFSAFGGVLVYDFFLKKTKIKKSILAALAVGVFAVFLVAFLEDYVYHAPRAAAPSMLYGRKEAILVVESIKGNYSEIVVSRSFSEPQMFVAFHTAWDPEDYQRQTSDWLRYESEGLPFLDQLGEYRLGKYTFKSIDFNSEKDTPGILMVGKPEEFPANVIPLHIIYYPDGEAAFYLVDPSLGALAGKQN